MPVIFRHRGFNVFFYSNEGSPREPMHVHIEKDECEAKIWVESSMGIAYNDGYNAKQLRELVGLVIAHEARIKRASHDFFR